MTPDQQKVVLATSNPGKLREVRAVLGRLGLEVEGLDGSLPEPEEDGATFEENARIKARAYATLLGVPCLAEDSGLLVDALGGAPGVHSARYAGSVGTRAERDERNNRKLLEALASVPASERTARFVSAMCLAAPDGTLLAEAQGTLEGRVASAPRGTNGFGYDPLFVVEGLERTSAELTSDEKNARSHRGQATLAIANRLRVVFASDG